MRLDAKGTTLAEEEVVVRPDQLEDVELAIGTPTAGVTATLVPFFGPTAAGGESVVVDGLGMDLQRALLAGLEYEWTRPFVEEEPIRVRVHVQDVFEKGSNHFGIVVAEFHNEQGELVQRQTATFIERGAA